MNRRFIFPFAHQQTCAKRNISYSDIRLKFVCIIELNSNDGARQIQTMKTTHNFKCTFCNAKFCKSFISTGSIVHTWIMWHDPKRPFYFCICGSNCTVNKEQTIWSTHQKHSKHEPFLEISQFESCVSNKKQTEKKNKSYRFVGNQQPKFNKNEIQQNGWERRIDYSFFLASIYFAG